MRYSVRWLLPAVLLATVLGSSSVTYAADAVDVALVLVTDVSRSIDDREFDLEKDGYAAAFTNPTVLAAIRSGVNGAIAVAYVEFAGSNEVRTGTGVDQDTRRGIRPRLRHKTEGRTAIVLGTHVHQCRY